MYAVIQKTVLFYKFVLKSLHNILDALNTFLQYTFNYFKLIKIDSYMKTYLNYESLFQSCFLIK